MKRYDEALAAYDRVVAINPNDAWVWHNKSLLLMSLAFWATNKERSLPVHHNIRQKPFSSHVL